MNNPLELWQKKKLNLEQELAISSDPNQKFTLREQIEECNREIARLSNQPQPTFSPEKKLNSDELVELAEKHLATMPTDEIAAFGTLPKSSRMSLRHNANFVGRDDALKAIAKALKSGETTNIGQASTVTGIGGVGKTQLACEFVHRYGQYFQGGVFWLSFAEDSAIESEIAECGTQAHLKLFGKDEQNLEIQVSLVQAAWREAMPRLLIFDNCEDPKLLTKWQPTTGGCRVLVTSRRGQWQKGVVKTLALGLLSDIESLELLLKYRPDLAEDREQKEVMAQIAKELGYLPLALHLAGRFLDTYKNEKFGQPKTYLETLGNDTLEQVDAEEFEDEDNPTKHDNNVKRTFKLSYEQLNSDNKVDNLAIALLSRAAYFAPGEAIPRELWKATLGQDLLDTDMKVERQVGLGITRLVNLGLVDEINTGSVIVHRLIVLFVQKFASQTQAQVDVEKTLLEESRRLNNAGYPQALIRLQTHLIWLTDKALIRNDEIAASLSNSLAYHLQSIASYVAAKPYYERALEINEEVLGEKHPDTASSLNNLGYLLRAMGELSQAKPYYERALEIYEEVLGAKHPDTASSLNNLGGLLQAMGELSQAKPYYERALAIYEEVLGAKHPDTASSLNNLGYLLRAMGELSQAKPYYERALEIYEEVLGAKHPDTASSLNNLGGLLRAMGELSKAKPYYERALAIVKEKLGVEHATTKIMERNLAILLEELMHK